MYSIPITPKPTPRPRLGKHGAYNPKSYTAYKKKLVQWLALLKVPSSDYNFIYAKFYVPYPKNTPKKDRIDCMPLDKVFDCDNVIKGLCDALEQGNIIPNDRCFSTMLIEKYRTTEEHGRIEFELKKTTNAG